jgi:hypothetical protein
MPAFKLPADISDGEEIIFATSLDKVDPEISGAVPAPEFDQYESIGYVPAQAFIENGWWMYCDECDRRSDCEDDECEEDEDPVDRVEPVEHVFRGQFYFCCPDCAHSWQARRDRVKADQAKFWQYLEGRYPGIIAKNMIGGDDADLYCSIDFPGGSGYFTQAAKTAATYFNTYDHDAWAVFSASCLTTIPA